MPRTDEALIITAHPDDETIFFGGTILSHPEKNWTVVCLTDGNADGRGKEREAELREACQALGVAKVITGQFPDCYEKNLDPVELLKFLDSLPKDREVYTHGPLGEYGHPHHILTSLCVHKTFLNTQIWHPAINCFSTKVVPMTPLVYEKKLEILANVYEKELIRFSRIINFPSNELFTQTSLDEVIKLCEFLIEGGDVPKGLQNYQAFRKHLKLFRSSIHQRAF